MEGGGETDDPGSRYMTDHFPHRCHSITTKIQFSGSAAGPYDEVGSSASVFGLAAPRLTQ